MKNNPNKFSGAVSESFNGRNNVNDSATETIPVKLNNTPSDKSSSSKKLNESNNESNIKKIDIINEDERIDQKGRTDKGLGKNADGSFRQSKAGRKPTTKSKKKVQLPLTLTPTTKEALDKWASPKPRSAANYLSEYVEEHLTEIIEYFNK